MTTNTTTAASPKSLTTGPWVVVSPVSRDPFRISVSNHLLTHHQPDAKPQPVDKQIGEWTHVERTQQEEEEEEWEQVKSVSDAPALLDKSIPQARSLIRSKQPNSLPPRPAPRPLSQTLAARYPTIKNPTERHLLHTQERRNSIMLATASLKGCPTASDSRQQPKKVPPRKVQSSIVYCTSQSHSLTNNAAAVLIEMIERHDTSGHGEDQGLIVCFCLLLKHKAVDGSGMPLSLFSTCVVLPQKVVNVFVHSAVTSFFSMMFYDLYLHFRKSFKTNLTQQTNILQINIRSCLT